MLSVSGKKLSELLQDLYDRYGELHSAEYDWALTPESREEIARIILRDKRLPECSRKVEKVSYMDGCKVYLEGGWVIVRFSGTEPRVRIFAEAETEEEARETVKKMARFAGLAWTE